MASNGSDYKMEESIYWTRFQTVQFFRKLRGRFDRQLEIPQKFTDHLKSKLAQPNVALKGPSGASWQVRLEANGEQLFFNEGWKEFAQDHSLKEDDVLVFTYNLDSRFDVLIFDGKSSCEKEASYFVKKCAQAKSESEVAAADNYPIPTSDKTSSDDFESVQRDPNYDGSGSRPRHELVQSSRPKTKRGYRHRTLPHRRPATKHAPQSSTQKILQGLRRPLSAAKPVLMGEIVVPKRKRSDVSGNETNPAASESVAKKRETPVEQQNRPPTSQPESYKRAITVEQQNRAIALADAEIRTWPPSFRVLLRKSHISHIYFMTIPIRFAREHLPSWNKDVVLRMDGQTWMAKLYHRDGALGLTGQGWKDFLGDNGINEFDVCLFTLDINTMNPIVLDVRIFFAGDDKVVGAPPATVQVVAGGSSNGSGDGEGGACV